MGLCSRLHDLPKLHILFAVLLPECLDFGRQLLMTEMDLYGGKVLQLCMLLVHISTIDSCEDDSWQVAGAW